MSFLKSAISGLRSSFPKGRALFCLVASIGILWCNAQPCQETNQWKYQDYTQKPLFANKVFTKGFGVYIQWQGTKKQIATRTGGIRDAILQGFQVALTNWGVSLLMNKDHLDPSIQKYIDDYSFKQGNNRLYNAPMVFTVDCPEDANFVILVYFQKGKKFPDDKNVLAESQIKGRTILLNLHDHQAMYEQRLFDIRDSAGNLNIVPILAHELGHSFGLVHTTGHASIMAASLDLIARFPTQQDGLDLAKVLLTAIEGTAPGYFSPTDCAGLKEKDSIQKAAKRQANAKTDR